MQKLTTIARFPFGVLNRMKKTQKILSKRTSLKPIMPSYQYQDKVGTATYEEMKFNLTPQQQRLIETKAMERPFTGMLWAEDSTGFYHCAVCDTRLFSFDHKFQTKTGYASFWRSAPERVNIIDQPVQFDHVNYARMNINERTS